ASGAGADPDRERGPGATGGKIVKSLRTGQTKGGKGSMKRGSRRRRPEAGPGRGIAFAGQVVYNVHESAAAGRGYRTRPRRREGGRFGKSHTTKRSNDPLFSGRLQA